MSPTVVCYWIITTRQNAVNEQWRSDSQKTRSGIKCRPYTDFTLDIRVHWVFLLLK